MTRRVPSAVLHQLREESGLTYENIARELNVTIGALNKWKNSGVTIEVLVLMLNFAATNGHKNSAHKMARALQDACGPRVAVILRPRK